MYKEIDNTHPYYDNLVAYWKFNDGTGTTATDFKGDNDGALNNFSGIFWVTTIAPLATTFTSDKTDLISIWSADNSNSSSILTITDSDVSGSNRIAFGHNNGSLSANTSDKPDGIDRRLNRVWRVEKNAGLAGDFVFDCSGLGIGASGDLCLLEDQDGTFSDATIIEGSYDGTDFIKTSYTFKDGYYYTLASTSGDNSLPVELVDFLAIAGDGIVTLNWFTESELDNLGFNIYRNTNANDQFSKINDQLIPGAGNSSSKHEYEYVDNDVKNGITYWYKLEDVDFGGNTKLNGPVSATPVERGVSKAFRLYPNYPNPFNPVTTISYDLPEDGYVELVIYNMLGEKVVTLIRSNQAAGSYMLNWDGTNQNGELVTSGLYFLKIASGKYLCTNKMIFIR